MEDSDVFFDKAKLDSILQEFENNPTLQKQVEEEISRKCDYYNKHPFPTPTKEFFLEKIKRTITFYNSKYENTIQEPLKFLMMKLHKWLYFTDEEIIEIILSTAVGERIDGEPLWTFLIAPPGGSKTELLRAFQGEDFFHLSNLTPRTFVSGLMIKEDNKRRKVEDLLPQLNKKILIFKDFTTILEKSREARSEIIAQLREIYDGQFSFKCGTMDKVIRYNDRFGLIAGVTPIIDKYWKVMQQLGERFLKVRWNEYMKETTKRARDNEGKEKFMRAELQEAITNFFSRLDFSKIPTFDDEVFGDKISKIAEFTAISRTPISIQDYRSDFYFDYIPTPEQPTRLVKQFKKLCKSLAFIRKKEVVTDEELKTIIRISKDTIPQDRRAILEAIQGKNKNLYGISRSDIEKATKIPNSSVRKVLQQLTMLDLIKETMVDENKGAYNEKQFFYKLSDLASYMMGDFYYRVQEKSPKILREATS